MSERDGNLANIKSYTIDCQGLSLTNAKGKEGRKDVDEQLPVSGLSTRYQPTITSASCFCRPKQNFTEFAVNAAITVTSRTRSTMIMMMISAVYVIKNIATGEL